MKKKSRKCSAAMAALAAVLCVAVPAAGKGEKRKTKAVAQAVLGGSVFREDGFLVRGARVVVTNLDRPKEKKETTTDLQGEFAVRVPAGKGRYTIEVSAEGFGSEKKTVEVAGDERVDLTFHLSAAGK